MLRSCLLLLGFASGLYASSATCTLRSTAQTDPMRCALYDEVAQWPPIDFVQLGVDVGVRESHESFESVSAGGSAPGLFRVAEPGDFATLFLGGAMLAGIGIARRRVRRLRRYC